MRSESGGGNMKGQEEEEDGERRERERQIENWRERIEEIDR